MVDSLKLVAWRCPAGKQGFGGRADWTADVLHERWELYNNISFPLR